MTQSVHTCLRAAFLRRDRIAQQLAEQDRRIAAGIRALADEMGCSFLREEAARAMVMGDSKMEVR